jgi:hypothetical protein
MNRVDIWDNEETREAKAVGDALLAALWRAGLDVIDDVSIVGGCEHRSKASISLGKISIEDAEGAVRTLNELARVAGEARQGSAGQLKRTEEEPAGLQR